MAILDESMSAKLPKSGTQDSGVRVEPEGLKWRPILWFGMVDSSRMAESIIPLNVCAFTSRKFRVQPTLNLWQHFEHLRFPRYVQYTLF